MASFSLNGTAVTAADDHPHLLEAFEHRDNAKDHMFRDVYFAAARFTDQR